MDYNVTIEVRARGDEITDELVDGLLELFGDAPVAVGVSDHGWCELVVTLPASSLRTSVSLALGLVGDAALTVSAMPTSVFDRRLEQPELPELLSVTEYAERHGVTRQAVLQRLESGSLAGRKVGSTWVIPLAAA